MRILLAGLYVPRGKRHWGGVTSWIWTVGRALERKGHLVAEWQPGMPVPETEFDLGILANAGHTKAVLCCCRRVLQVCHGVVHTDAPAPATVFVSEGTRAKWPGATGPVIRQPIDLEFWSPGEESRARSGAVRFSYRAEPTLCAAAADRLGMPFRESGCIQWGAARALLRQADLVFASGRAALEAMACGARVVIYDHRRSYQGPLLDTDLGRQLTQNYSGRGGVNPTLDQVVAAARAARSNREWVLRHHASDRIADQLLRQAGVG